MDWNREQERKAGKAMGIGMHIFAIVFMVFWCAMAAGLGGGFMLIFGLPMLGFMIFRLVILLKKTKAEQKPREPWEQTRSGIDDPDRSRTYSSGFCAYCGTRTESGFVFCPKCGRRLSR